MANEVFKPIEEFTLTSPTGSEQIQVSATQKVTLLQIAQLVKSAPLLSSEVTVTNFETHSYTGRYSFSEIPNNTAFSFKAAASATNGPGVAVYGLAIKIASDTAIYFAGGDSSGAQYCIYGVSGAGTTIKNLLYGEGLTKVDVTDFKALPTILSSVPSGTVVAYRAANTVANGPVSGAGSWGFIFKINSSTYRVIANIFGGTAAGWGYDLYVGSIGGTTTAYWSKINGASEIPDNVKYLSQTYVTEDPTTLWSELESITNSGSVNAGDFFPFRFNANTPSMPTTSAGHGIYQYGTNCAYAIIFEEAATGGGRAWFGHFESNDGAVEWTEFGKSSERLTGAIKITAFTEAELSSKLNTWKTGDLVPFYTDLLTKSSANQAPESNAFSGFISMSLNEGDHWMVMAIASNGNSYVGHVLGSTASWTKLGGGGSSVDPIVIGPSQDVFDGSRYPFSKVGEIFPIFIDTNAEQNPSKEGYPCIGTVQCVGYHSSVSWEAVLVVGSADEDLTPKGDYYKAQMTYDEASTWIELGAQSSGGGMVLAGSESSYPITNDSGTVTLSNVNPGDHLLIQAMIVGTGTKTSPQGCFMTGCTVPEAGAQELLILVQDFNGSEDAHFMAGTVSVGNPGIEFELTLLSPSSIASMQIQRMWKLP